MITVIIPIYNEENAIENCLKSLLDQAEKDFEVIVVDDGSTDNSKVITQNLKLQFKNQKLILLEQSHKGPGAARNLAAKHARGEILVFVDADMAFDDNFLKMLTKPIVSGKAKGTFSKYEYVSNWDNVWARCWNINEGWEPKRRHPKNYPDHQPVFRAIAKSEFLRVGGFTPGGYNDDWSLGKKLSYDAVSAPGAVFYHENPGSLHEIFFHAKWVGKRPYKLGIIGDIVALVRVFLPISLLVGCIKSITNKEPAFIIFKTVYNTAITLGIFEKVIYGKMAK
jgi:glycosyltransferase involved in cell wall biosynthesis